MTRWEIALVSAEGLEVTERSYLSYDVDIDDDRRLIVSGSRYLTCEYNAEVVAVRAFASRSTAEVYYIDAVYGPVVVEKGSVIAVRVAWNIEGLRMLPYPVPPPPVLLIGSTETTP